MKKYRYISDAKLKKINSIITEKFSNEVLKAYIEKNELTIIVKKSSLLNILNNLKDDKDLDFKQLIDICAVDYPNNSKRFELVYHLLSLSNNYRVRIKTNISDGEIITSVVSCYSAASWFEREIWDLFGIIFSNHPDLRRILTDYGFTGHPLRKDFPLTGFVEVHYDEKEKRVVNKSVSLTQDFRTFDFESPWEGLNSKNSTELNKEK